MECLFQHYYVNEVQNIHEKTPVITGWLPGFPGTIYDVCRNPYNHYFWNVKIVVKALILNTSIKFMRLISSILVLISFSLSAQTPDPVKWSYSMEQSTKGEATLILKATIDKGWHLYSQNIGDGGPIKTTFTFAPSTDYTLTGPVAEGKPTEYYDKSFEMQLAYFSGVADFKQKIKINNTKDFSVSGTVEYMVCDDEKCLPPKLVEFKINVSGQ